MPVYDVIVLGTGGVGSAALYHAARRGMRVLGIDRFAPGHDRGSSHGDTRVIRLAYFEHPDYVPILRRAYKLWEELERASGRPLYDEVGLLEAGPLHGIVVGGVLTSAVQHNLEVDRMTPDEAMKRFPGFRIRPEHTAVFERRAGYLRVEDCVRTHIDQALRRGAKLHVGEAVKSWRPDGEGVLVETDSGRYVAHRLIITAGAWSSDFLDKLGIKFEVRRKILHWFHNEHPGFRATDRGPSFFFENERGFFYGIPQVDAKGVKIAEHTGGETVLNPLTVSREADPLDDQRIEEFVAESLPSLSLNRTARAICMYTMSPDEHFIIDRHPEHPQVVFTAGLSGHGFKFTSALGEVMTDLALDGHTNLPIDFFSTRRFKK